MKYEGDSTEHLLHPGHGKSTTSKKPEKAIAANNPVAMPSTKAVQETLPAKINPKLNKARGAII